MNPITGRNRRFLFLQGPHGPFFSRLARMLKASGAQVWRVGFNRGDRFFWPDSRTFIPYRDHLRHWPETLHQILAEKSITDLVLYGDTRAIHSTAVATAKRLGVTIHVFEEGYLRPYWITYERGGANGHSRLMEMSVEQMRHALANCEMELPDAPATWGDMRHHVFYGALYHFFVLFLNREFRNHTPHRSLSVAQEFRLYQKRLLLMPFHAAERFLATMRIKHGGFPYHLALLQLEHDASFQQHGPFSSQTEFIDTCIDGFARGAPPHHHLVFKTHPLEDGRAPIARAIRLAAQRCGVRDRVHLVRGGKLATLLNQAKSAVTVNSTAAQQVLWRGMPLKTFGNAVYSMPEFVSSQPLTEFFGHPERPDARAYRDYRHYLLETSQVRGGYYSSRGRRELLRKVVDMILADQDPYDALAAGNATDRQQLRVTR